MSGHTLKYFMWPWQHFFQHLAADNARRLLKPLDPQLDCGAFIVGFLAEEAEDAYAICVSPDHCPFQPVVFEGVPELMERLAKDDPGFKIRYTAPTAPDLGERMARDRGLQGAVEQTLAGIDPTSRFFASPPTLVQGYHGLVVVRVDRERFDSHYRLTRDFVGKGAIRYPVGRSLIETTIQSYLEALVEKLRQPDPGKDIRLIRDYPTIYRAAADKLMRGPAWAGGDLIGLPDIYEVCNTISLQNYEGQEGAGRLAFARKDHPNIRIALALRTPVQIYDYGAVRKLLEMCSGRLCLFCDSLAVYGLGTVENYDPRGEDLFVVRFIKRFTWELSHAGNVMMHCREGKPHLRPPGPSAAPIREALQRVFKGVEVERLVGLAETVAEQEHGAMLVITPSAATEATRLANQATVLEPTPLTPELVPLVTAIDGAVLIDLEGTCHAIGVILDGPAHDKCTSGRGARYNSAVRYAYQEGKTDRVVLVKSADGMVNVLPEPST